MSGNKYRKRDYKSIYNIERIFDAIEVLQLNKSRKKVLYVPKRAYQTAKKLLKSEGKNDVKIKTY